MVEPAAAEGRNFFAEELRSRGATPETILSTRLPPSVAWLTLWLASRRLGAWMVIDASPEGPHTDGTDTGPCLEVSAACTSEIGGFTVDHAPWPSDAPAPRGDGGGLAWLTATGALVERGEEELVTMLGRPDALRDGAVEVRSKWTGPGDLGDIVAALRGPEELYLPCASR